MFRRPAVISLLVQKMYPKRRAVCKTDALATEVVLIGFRRRASFTRDVSATSAISCLKLTLLILTQLHPWRPVRYRIKHESLQIWLDSSTNSGHNKTQNSVPFWNVTRYSPVKCTYVSEQPTGFITHWQLTHSQHTTAPGSQPFISVLDSWHDWRW